MALRDRVLKIKAVDETQGAVSTVQSGLERLGSSFDFLKAGAAAAILAIGGFLDRLTEAGDKAASSLRQLNIAVAGFSEDQKTLFTQLIAGGFAEENAISAVSAVAGQSSRLGFDPANERVARTFALYGEAGGDPTQLSRALNTFGVRGEEDVVGAANAIFTSAGAQDVSASEIASAFQRYGPLGSQLGLTAPETAELFTDLIASGVNISRVAPGINRFLRDNAELSREERREAFGAILEDIGSGDGLGLATEQFGAEGALRLTSAAEGGHVGLLPQQLATPGGVGLGVATPTQADVFQGTLDAQSLAGGVSSVASAGTQAGFGIPGYSSLARGLFNVGRGVGRLFGIDYGDENPTPVEQANVVVDNSTTINVTNNGASVFTPQAIEESLMTQTNGDTLRNVDTNIRGSQ